MHETTRNLGESPAPVPHARTSRWVWLGPLLVVLAVISGVAGWEAWQHRQFEKERTETPPHVVADLKLKLLWIPAGTFVMGTEDEAEWLKSLKNKYNNLKPASWVNWKGRTVWPDQMPTWEVTLKKGFYLGETEVTQEQWAAVMGNHPSWFKGPNRPVENVSWDDCVEFCRKLTERERTAGRIGSTQAFRLPTEAEWEYACRAGSSGEYSFGDDVSKLGDFAWFRDNSVAETHEVGMKRLNDWGLKDIHGNVSEWCADWYEAYPPRGKMLVLTGVASRSHRVTRGGSWGHFADGCRSAFRGDLSPDIRYNALGLRLALSSIP